MRLAKLVPHALRLGLFLLPLCALLLWAGLSFPGTEAAHDFMKQHRGAHPGLRVFMEVVTDWGNAVFYVVYLGILIRGWRRGRRDLVRLALTYLVVQLLISFLIVRALKIVTGCPRPGEGGLCRPLSMDSAHHSLPSGHTTEIVGAAGGLVLWLGSWWVSIGLGLFTALVAFSRVYLGSHHVHDVLFGMLLGAYAASAIASFAKESS